MYTNISNHLPQLNGKADKYVTHLSVKSMALSLLAPSIMSYSKYRNPSVIVTRVRHDKSTSNLVRHADRCAPGATTTTSSITSFAHDSTYSYPKFRVKLALWVARRHRPFSIVEDKELINIFMDLNNKVEVPSHVTVSHDVKEIFQISRSKSAEILQVGHSLSCVLHLLTSLTNRLIRGSFIYVSTVGRPLR
jgi:hypothetical protein